MTTNYSYPSLFRPLVMAGAVVLLLAAIWALSSFLAPVMFALFLAIIAAPVYGWLKRRGLPPGLAMPAMIVLVVVLGASLIFFVLLSFNRLAVSLAGYAAELDIVTGNLQSWLAARGISATDAGLLATLDTRNILQWLARFLGRAGNLAAMFLFVLFTLIFALLEAGSFKDKLAQEFGTDSRAMARVLQFTQSVVRYFALRAVVNLVTGTAVSVMLLVMGVDHAILWGILTFFMSFVPYLGIFLATVPSVLLALVQYGPGSALVVIAGVAVINVGAENAVAPKLMGHGLSLSPLVVFLAFFFWSFLLGPLGMFLAMPLTVITQFLLDGFAETRWLARLIAASPPPSTPAE